jgi:catechol 2,3-dioxygenase-like lactoylglutathione lyase family enzyme
MLDMTIMRVEGVTFGVEDLAECSRFLEDAGLQRDPAGAEGGVTFRTPVNQYVRIVPVDSTEVPPPTDKGSTIREIMWGVDSEKSLEQHRLKLADRNVRVDASGSIHAIDPIGFGIAFMVTQPKRPQQPPPSYNFHRHHAPRVNDLTELTNAANPLEIIHVAVDIPQSLREEARAFYIDLLKFKPIDDADDIGVFMQAEGDLQHHNWFLCHRTDKPGINHLCFEVPDFDSVILSAEHMIAKGWRESRRLGRHVMGSNVFRFIYSPLGGRFEFAWDMDRMDKNFKTRTYAKRPGHVMWMLKGVGGRAD